MRGQHCEGWQDSKNKYLMWSLRQQEPRYLTLFLEDFQVNIKTQNEKSPRVVLLETGM